MKNLDKKVLENMVISAFEEARTVNADGIGKLASDDYFRSGIFASKIINRLPALYHVDANVDVDKDNIDKLRSNLEGIFPKMKKTYDAVNSIETTTIDKIIDFIKSIFGLDTNLNANLKEKFAEEAKLKEVLGLYKGLFDLHENLILKLSQKEENQFPELRATLKGISEYLTSFKKDFEKEGELTPEQVKLVYEKFNEFYKELEKNTEVPNSTSPLRIALNKGTSDMKKSSHFRKVLFEEKESHEINK